MKTDLNDLKEELDSIRADVARKQDKISPAIWVPLLMWGIGWSITGIWWAASLTTQLEGLEKVIVTNTEGGYRTADATRDQKLALQKDDYLQLQIDNLKHSRDTAEKNLKEHIKECNEMVRGK